ncbi:MAG: 16S rRNA (adenine(1518)-N(6)/adenine(1519)-N(6))-dimethyltransferase RsmA [Candidatus Taylorbacteria bacterium]|nr:16S rRNA (adenine(1518)-N(6)/adenine(1519)-N(6))-dimethyltransferase RsmA [Candidatus Taylorbacteria bacterium]
MELHAKKSLGQHFLNSPLVLAKIIETADIKVGEKILEIGPGTGILTKALLNTDAVVISIEKDDRACELLQEKFMSNINAGTLALYHADILETDRKTYGLNNGNYAVVANIPYYITGAILKSFLEIDPRPNRMVLLVQKEVAERIVARDGKESLLSISVKAFGSPKLVAKVPRGAFNPPPTVDSAILLIENISDRRFTEKGLEIRRFFDILKASFAHKRKFAKRNLETLLDPEHINKIWQKLGLNDKVRPEDITVEQWVNMACE